MPYSIGDFAQETGLSIYTLRYYEKEELIKPERDAHNQRQYAERDKAWIDFILRLKETAMPLREIKRYAKLRYAGEATLKERLAILRVHREAILEKRRVLENNLALLEKKIETYETAILQYESR
ncbi:MAG: MerR family transcriptional regulator [Sporolactobacillus sp.]